MQAFQTEPHLSVRVPLSARGLRKWHSPTAQVYGPEYAEVHPDEERDLRLQLSPVCVALC